jgi:hypothetical protein
LPFVLTFHSDDDRSLVNKTLTFEVLSAAGAVVVAEAFDVKGNLKIEKVF